MQGSNKPGGTRSPKVSPPASPVKSAQLPEWSSSFSGPTPSKGLSTKVSDLFASEPTTASSQTETKSPTEFDVRPASIESTLRVGTPSAKFHGPEGPTKDSQDLPDSTQPTTHEPSEPPALAPQQSSDEGRPPTAEPGRLTLASTSNDDCWDRTVVDRLRVAPDARAFARLVASRAFNPPLAVGVFGPWGAGKSFFMRLVHDHIDRLSEGQPCLEAPEASKEQFHQDIVQIRFNAWHYVETNLWASLIDHLFTQLALRMNGGGSESNALDQLGTARDLTLEAAQALAASRREHARAEASVKLAEQALAERVQTLRTDPELYAQALFEALHHGEGAADLRTAADQLGLPPLQTDLAAIGKSWNDLRHELDSGRALISGLTQQLGSRWGWAVGFIMGVPLLVGWALSYAASTSFGGFATVTATLASGLATVTGLLGTAVSAVRTAINKLKVSAAALEKAAERKVREARAELADQRSMVEAARARVDEAQAVYRLSQARLAQATEEFYGSTGAARLIKFIRTRASDGHYASHLGLVASVRRDLEELSRGLDGDGHLTVSESKSNQALEAQINNLVQATGLTNEEIDSLRAQLKPRQAVPPPFKRLVLYIDDLDRCPTDKVVEVLQAVHMLLAFRLFVVFVAVDVRWVTHALTEQHPALLASGDHARPTPGDYLEKIFQIPYWVRAVDREGSMNLLDSLLPRTTSAAHETLPTVANSGTVRAITPEALTLSEEERQALRRLVPYVAATPRRILWLTNAYRLIKANDEYATELSTSAAASQALISQLVLVAADPANFDIWYRHLSLAPGDTDIDDLLFALRNGWNEGQVHPGMENSTTVPTTAQQVFDILGTGLMAPGIHVPLLRKYAELSRRHSFAIGAS